MRLLTTFSIALIAGVALGECRLAKLFVDHAVVQRDRPLPVWGTGVPNASVSVSLHKSNATTIIGDDGRWQVTLGPQPATTNPQTLTVQSDGHMLERTDVLIGDVWHASGQSNMGMKVSAALKTMPRIREVAGTFDRPSIRFLRINEGPSRSPLAEIQSDVSWTACTKESVNGFSAVAYFFAAKLQAESQIPIGIIDTSRGGTPIEPFIPESAFVDHPTLIREKELGDQDDLDAIWRMPGGVRARSDVWLPGRLFHSRLWPIKRFPVSGCIWYQGESNCGVQEDPRDYQHKMRALIRGWRQELGNEQLPFFFVQLPGFERGTNWPYLREQQRLAMDVPGTGMIVTIDLEHPDIHPPNKLDVGYRIANWALAKHYNRKVPFSGPMFSETKVDTGRIIARFDHAESGLMIGEKQGLQSAVEDAKGELKHFEITADGDLWMPATATIHGNSVSVANDSVPNPIAIRYAFRPAPSGSNLFNRDGLPASPFCSRPELLKCDPDLPE